LVSATLLSKIRKNEKRILCSRSSSETVRFVVERNHEITTFGIGTRTSISHHQLLQWSRFPSILRNRKVNDRLRNRKVNDRLCNYASNHNVPHASIAGFLAANIA
jgi:hypothetical protein